MERVKSTFLQSIRLIILLSTVYMSTYAFEKYYSIRTQVEMECNNACPATCQNRCGSQVEKDTDCYKICLESCKANCKWRGFIERSNNQGKEIRFFGNE